MKFLHFKNYFKNELFKNISIVILCVSVSTSLSFFIISPKAQAPARPVCEDKVVSKKISAGAQKSLFVNDDFIADIVEDIAPSVVHITTEIEAKLSQDPRQFFFEDDFFKHFFGFDPFEQNFPRAPMKRNTAGTGSGTIISQDGYILTNYHVVQNAKKITVKIKGDKEYEAKLIGKDKYSDLAVIKIEENNLVPAKMSDSKKIRPGQWAIAVGSPHGLDHTVTLGIISAISREIPELSNVSFIQTDAAINPGNSGGPLLNIKGEIVGINTAIIGSAQNIGFAIPVNVAKKIVEQLKSGETIGHPWIGIAMSPLTKELAEAMGFSEKTRGVVISRVMPKSPADKHGLMQGDVIQRIDGKKLSTPAEVQAIIKKKKVGDTINLQILREGIMIGKKIKLGNWEDN